MAYKNQNFMTNKKIKAAVDKNQKNYVDPEIDEEQNNNQQNENQGNQNDNENQGNQNDNENQSNQNDNENDNTEQNQVTNVMKIIVSTEEDFLTISSDDPFVFTGDNLSVDWGDGSEIATYTGGTFSHTYDTIGDYEINIVGNITEINDSALQFSKEVIIPPSVTSMGNYLFSWITNKVTFESAIPPTFSEDTFYVDAEYGFTIRVPTNSLTSYANATGFPKESQSNYALYTIEEYTPQ